VLETFIAHLYQSTVLFRLANQLMRQSQYTAAGLVFENLALLDPRFGPYQQNAAFAKAKLGLAPQHTLHFSHASNLKWRLRIAHVQAQLGLYDDARACLGMVDEPHPLADALLCLAHVARLQGEAETVWLGWLNRYLALYDLPPLALGPAGSGAGGVFARLQRPPPQLPEVFQEKWLVGMLPREFISRLAFYMGEINAVHPFRESNERVQRLFFSQLAQRAGYFVDFESISQDQMYVAMIASFNGNLKPLENLLNENTAIIEP
jgi:hypothetical protein